MSVREKPELLGEAEAVIEVLRGHKVFRHLDAAVEVLDLVWCAGGNEDRVAHTLHDGVAQHSILLVQPVA